jgi:hypothetical protein
MQRVGLIYLCTTAVLTLAACSSNQAGPEPAGNPYSAPSSTSMSLTLPARSPVITDSPATQGQPAPTSGDTLPTGYPKVVTVTSLPDQVRNWFQMSGDTQAVQLAPGVWTPLQPGATVDDAVNAGVLDGFCSSIKAFERQYRSGRKYPGACW